MTISLTYVHYVSCINTYTDICIHKVWSKHQPLNMLAQVIFVSKKSKLYYNEQKGSHMEKMKK